MNDILSKLQTEETLSVNEIIRLTDYFNNVKPLLKEKQENYMKNSLIPFLNEEQTDSLLHLSEDFLKLSQSAIKSVLYSFNHDIHNSYIFHCSERSVEDIRYLMFVKLFLIVNGNLQIRHDRRLIAFIQTNLGRIEETFELINKIANGKLRIGASDNVKSEYWNWEFEESDIFISDDIDYYSVELRSYERVLDLIFVDIDLMENDIDSIYPSVIKLTNEKIESEYSIYHYYYEKDELECSVRDMFCENIIDIVYHYIF